MTTALYRWVGWRRVDGGNPFGDGTIDNFVQKSAGRLHAVEGQVGGYSDQGLGEAGKAVCGTAVPDDNPDRIMAWYEYGIRCKRCEAKLAKSKEKLN